MKMILVQNISNTQYGGQKCQDNNLKMVPFICEEPKNMKSKFRSIIHVVLLLFEVSTTD